MKRSPFYLAGAAMGLLVIAGCVSSGLSPRETRGQDYSTCVFSMYEPMAHDPAQVRKLTVLPAKVAVAQLGEVAPPAAMIELLRNDHAVFARADPIPGVLSSSVVPYGRVSGPDAAAMAQKQAHDHADRMRAYARDIGADYLFLFGGTVDRETSDTALSLADLTVIGAFLVPSKEIKGAARASGSLVDVNTGRVVLAVSADSTQGRMSAAVSRNGNETKMLEALRDEVTTKLAEQLKEQMKAESARKS